MSNSPLPALLHDLTIARELMLAGHHAAGTRHIEIAIGRIADALFPAAVSVLQADDKMVSPQAGAPDADIRPKAVPA